MARWIKLYKFSKIRKQKMTASEYFEKLIDLAFQQAKKKLDDYGSDGRKILLQDMENNPDIHHGILQQRLLEIV